MATIVAKKLHAIWTPHRNTLPVSLSVLRALIFQTSCFFNFRQKKKKKKCFLFFVFFPKKHLFLNFKKYFWFLVSLHCALNKFLPSHDFIFFWLKTTKPLTLTTLPTTRIPPRPRRMTSGELCVYLLKVKMHKMVMCEGFLFYSHCSTEILKCFLWAWQRLWCVLW